MNCKLNLKANSYILNKTIVAPYKTYLEENTYLNKLKFSRLFSSKLNRRNAFLGSFRLHF